MLLSFALQINSLKIVGLAKTYKGIIDGREKAARLSLKSRLALYTEGAEYESCRTLEEKQHNLLGIANHYNQELLDQGARILPSRNNKTPWPFRHRLQSNCINHLNFSKIIGN